MAAGTAQGIHSARELVNQSWLDLLDAIKNGVTPTVERAKLIGELASKTLRLALKSGDPAVRAQAAATKQAIIDRLGELGANAKNIGEKGMAALARAMKSKDPDIRAAAKLIYNAASKVAPPKSKAFEWGKAIGQGLVDGLNAMSYKVGAAAGNLANVIADYLATHSPAKRGPLSLDGGPEGMGRRIVALITKGVEGEMPRLSTALGAGLRLPAFYAAPAAASAVRVAWPAMPAGGLGSGETNNYNLTVEGLVQARDPAEIAREMRRVAQFKPSIDRTRPLAMTGSAG
jgi:hypothetical protein